MGNHNRTAGRMRAPRWMINRRAAALGFLLLLAGVPDARSQTVATAGRQFTPSLEPVGVTIQAPSNRAFSRRSGLALFVDARWASNFGYRPIQVTVNSQVPTTADLTITVRFHVSTWSEQYGRVTVEQEFQLPQGSTSATTTIAVPLYQQYQWTGAGYCWWDVWVDGVRDKDLSVDRNIAMGAGAAFGVNRSTPGISFLTVEPATAGGAAAAKSAFPWSQELELMSLPVGELPGSWIDYTSLDVVTISADDLARVASSNQAALDAIRRWVRAGGQIWIGDVGQGWEQLAAVERFLGPGRLSPATSLDAGAAQSDEEALERGWRPARLSPTPWDGRIVTFFDYRTGVERVVRDSQLIQQLENNSNYYAREERVVDIDRRTMEGKRPADSRRWFLEQPLGLGVVRVFRDEDAVRGAVRAEAKTAPSAAAVATAGGATSGGALPAAGPEPPMPATLAISLETTRSWTSRHGLTPDAPNADFSNWLVPGVGRAPVTEFRVLITLFVILIGPINYWLLRRRQRLHLLVLTVPLSAVLVTAGLFAFALMADGLRTRVRVRSCTMLDQRSGEAACWARLSYYSGLAPSRGLDMPADVAVYPINPGWYESGSRSDVAIAREIVRSDGRAQLTRGWLRSRTPTQYLTLRARKSPHRLRLGAGEGVMRAGNELGTAIRYVVVADASGKLFAGEGLAREEVADLMPVESTAAASRLQQLMRDHNPELPPALAGAAYGMGLTTSPNRMYYGSSGPYYRSSYGGERLAENLMHEALVRWTGVDGHRPSEWPNRTYVAVTEISPEVELGVDGAIEEASFHVIVGKW